VGVLGGLWDLHVIFRRILWGGGEGRGRVLGKARRGRVLGRARGGGAKGYIVGV
jgi:hypothetical protein